MEMHVRAEAAAAVAVAGEQYIFPEDAEELEQRSSSCYTQLGLMSGTIDSSGICALWDSCERRSS